VVKKEINEKEQIKDLFKQNTKKTF
jgi:hypothetical protein